MSWEPRDWVRLDGGAGYAFRIEPTNFAPWSLQAGTELRSPWTPWPGRLRPILAVDVQSREEHDWEPQLTLRAGIELEGATVLGRRAQVLFEYGSGRSVDGQFYRRDAEYIGLGLHFHY